MLPWDPAGRADRPEQSPAPSEPTAGTCVSLCAWTLCRKDRWGREEGVSSQHQNTHASRLNAYFDTFRTIPLEDKSKQMTDDSGRMGVKMKGEGRISNEDKSRGGERRAGETKRGKRRKKEEGKRIRRG